MICSYPNQSRVPPRHQQQENDTEKYQNKQTNKKQQINTINTGISHTDINSRSLAAM